MMDEPIEIDRDNYTVMEAIDALLFELNYLGLEFIDGSLVYEYDFHKKGQRVTLLSEDIPNFSVEKERLLLTNVEWEVEEIKRVSTAGKQDVVVYQTVFFLEDVI